MNPLRIYRKQSHLTQTEMGILLGYSDRGPIHAYERGSRELTLTSALSYSLICNIPIHELMPELAAKVRSELLNHVCILGDQLSRESSMRYRDEKLHALEHLYHRLNSSL